MHCSVSGITDHFAKDEAESFEIIRDVVATLNIEEPEEIASSDEPAFGGKEVLDTIAGIIKHHSS